MGALPALRAQHVSCAQATLDDAHRRVLPYLPAWRSVAVFHAVA